MEQLIVIAVFAICAAACVRILVASYLMATEGRDMSNAIRAAESGAECYKAVSGDVVKMAEIMGGNSAETGSGATAIVYYDKNWSVCDEQYAEYILRAIRENRLMGSTVLLSSELSVEKLSGEVIITIPVAARGIQDG